MEQWPVYPNWLEIAEKFNLKIVTIKDLISFLFQSESLIERGEEVNLPTQFGDFRIVPFRQKIEWCRACCIIKGKWESK